LPSLI